MDVEDKEVRQFVDWLELGVFDALQKKYLEVVLLEIYATTRPAEAHARQGATPLTQEGDSAIVKKLLECFSFSVAYGADGASFALANATGGNGATSQPIESKAQIKQSTSEVLRLLVELTASLAPLPQHRVISLKVSAAEHRLVDVALNRHPDLCESAVPTVDVHGRYPKRLRAAAFFQSANRRHVLVRREASSAVRRVGNDTLPPAKHEHSVDTGQRRC